MCNKYTVNNILFLAQIDSRTNTVYVHSCHPYDEQEYHWARQSERHGLWIVYRNGKIVTCKAKSLSEEDIAKYLYNLDRDLKPIMCYN